MTVPMIGSTAASSHGMNSTSKTTLGKDDFMKLLIAQMQHQDPLNPSDSSQMAAQLAQFSSLEQLTNISQQMAAQASDSATLVNTVNNSSAIGLLGKTVSVLDDTVQVGGTSPTHTASATVGAGGGDLTVRLEDANGFTVATNHVGRVAGGQQRVSMDSLTKGLPAGNYKVVFDVINGIGSTQTIAHPTSTVAARVDGIGFGTNGAVVSSGSKQYTIGQVLSVNATN
jgi:flagellar basal-body rod modification protein FlgD